MPIQILLENFSGPLDLLLHLIKTNEMDIYDIRIMEITEQYLSIIEQMKQLDLDVAGEFLLMAATLMHIKSRMLLPSSEEIEEEEGEDPRAELVRRLLEYQRYKEAARLFENMPQLQRDYFTGLVRAADYLELEDAADEEITVGIYQLAEAFHRILSHRPKEVFHEVVRESLSVAQYIRRLSARLAEKKRMAFHECFSPRASRIELVVTFLAMLELVKMRMINIEQVKEFSEIWLTLVVAPEQLDQLSAVEDALGYE
ncbi:segregation and condensation protein A [Pelobacter seleniigenes]|uniref:segregation and condensation protein A n=1 Tax=Pelobacter seleniigenes TaxID=407188 RepID=UPI00055A93C2|nr:segregation/condensation protein A [Pelobacter seleniigenes]